MRGLAISLVLFLGCGAGVRNGIVNDGKSVSGAEADGCNRDKTPVCGGLGYDEIAIAALVTTFATVLLTNKLRSR